MELVTDYQPTTDYQSAHILHDPFGTIVVVRGIDGNWRASELPLRGGFITSVLYSREVGSIGLYTAGWANLPGEFTARAILQLFEAQAPLIRHLSANLFDDHPVLLYPYGQFQQFPIQPALEMASRGRYPEILTIIDRGSVRRRRLRPRVGSVLVAADTGQQPLRASRIEQFVIPPLIAGALNIPTEEIQVDGGCFVFTFKEALERGGIIHYTGHSAALSVGQPRIILYDRPFEASEIARVDARSVSLILLNSCESGKEPLDPRNPQLTALASALIRAGCAHVISSYWPVLDRASFYFSVEFYSSVVEHGLTSRGIYRALAHAEKWLREVTKEEIDQQYAETIRRHPDVRLNDDMPPEMRPFSEPWCWAGFFLSVPNPE